MTLRAKRLPPKNVRRRKKARGRPIFTALRRILSKAWHSLEALMKAIWASPPGVRVVVISVLLILLWFSVNWAYHTLNKPSEILFPLDRSLNKPPMETWKQYESLFREHATATMTPEFLAALAQVEGGGNPVARTYWRWKLAWNPLEWYQPASSAVGMFQMTDGTFEEASHYCIHDHLVVEEGAWNDIQSCWFNTLYTRIVPSHAIELTAAFLDHHVKKILAPRRFKTTTLQEKQNLAAVIHLCGAGAGRAYAARGLRLTPHQRCGDHDVGRYLTRINSLKRRYSNSPDRDTTIRQRN